MTKASIDELLQRIAENGHDLWVAGPQSEADIARLEQALAVRLPPDYRQFLARFGAMSLYDGTICGIFDGDPLSENISSMYGATTDFRRRWKMPEYLLVVEPNEDAPYCLDTRRPDAAGAMPVCCYELHSGSDGQIAKSFDEYIVGWFLENWAEESSAEG